MRKKMRAGPFIGMVLLSFSLQYITVCAGQPDVEAAPIRSSFVLEEIDRSLACVVQVATEICNEGQLIKLKEMLENNSFENITFSKDEKAIVFYESSISTTTFRGYRILVYKETAEKDILLGCILGVEKETGDIYVLEEDWELIKSGVLKDLRLSVAPRAVWITEYGINDEVESELLDQVANYLKTEEGLTTFKIMYCGIFSFLGRRYYSVDLVEDNGDMIHRIKSYDIDMVTGDLYEESDHIVTGTRMGLYYMKNLEK